MYGENERSESQLSLRETDRLLSGHEVEAHEFGVAAWKPGEEATLTHQRESSGEAHCPLCHAVLRCEMGRRGPVWLCLCK